MRGFLASRAEAGGSAPQEPPVENEGCTFSPTRLFAKRVVVCGIAIAVAIAAVGIGYRFYIHWRKSKADIHQSMKQMSTLALTTRFLADDNSNILPAATNWCDALTRKYFEKWALKDPADISWGGCSYAYNTNVAGRSLIGMHPKTVFFFETKSGWNQHGGPEILLAQPRYSNTYLVACFDCSVLRVTKDQIPTLRWVPAYEAKKEE